MAEFIVNPRRAPRAPARCRASVRSAEGSFECETEDIGSRGCQIVAPRFLKRGETIEIQVSSGKIADPLRVRGKVAWVSAQAPWRVGVAFEEGSVKEASRWFDRLVAASPGLGALRRVPEKIAVEAMVFLGPPPRFVLDFTADEAALLRAIASGARLDELMARLKDRWPAAQRALFSLMARQAVTLSRGQAAHPDAWKRILTEVEASLAIEALGSSGATVAPPASPPEAAPSHPAATEVPRDLRAASPRPSGGAASSQGSPAPQRAAEIATPVPIRGGRADPDPGGAQSPSMAPKPDFTGAGVGWRAKAPRVRTAEAQAIFEQALAAIQDSNVNGAIALLRRALALSPGDPEIAAEIGKLAFKDRTGPA